MENPIYPHLPKDQHADPCVQHIMGWREWVSFPTLKIENIKAKVDTGARTSALHAFEVKVFKEDGLKMVDFSIHPVQYSQEKTIKCVSVLHDVRVVTDSGGHKELRPVIKTEICLGQITWEIEVSLTNRDDMRFRFLLGRSGLPKKFLVSASSSYLFKKNR